ncbi:hypothetical protein CYJ10_11800 [Cupriavidus pauculus]|uniref:Uncharacterized protein n=1 Tax=Cupriavidus pauculus TaxID=82633 RepID=A0A2N5CDI0_9BURK|nr:hypothetical protein CYJ10_11800 [Cupriavidus pauculus]
MTVQNWTRVLAQALLAIMLVVLAAVASRVIYIRMTPHASSEVREETEIHREIADCGAQRKPTELQERQSEDSAIWMASCLDS